MIDINKAKQKILDLAIRGKLTKQLKSDGNASDLLAEIQKEKEKQNIGSRKTRTFSVGASYASPKANNDLETPFEIPENWVWCRFAELYDINPEVIANKNDKAAFIPMEKIGAGYENKFDYIIQDWEVASKAHTKFCNGDVCFAKISPCFENRKSFIANNLPNGIGGGTTELIVIRQNKVMKEFTYLIVLDERFIFECSKSYKGVVGQQRIKRDILDNYLIPLPPLAEQNRIVEKVDKLFEILDKIDEAQKKYQKDKEVLKSKIIEAGIRGKLTKQLKTDGNASDLLDEIRKEKEKLIKEGKIKGDKKVTFIYKKHSDNLYYEKYQDGTEKCMNDELPFEIPEKWTWCRQEQVCLLYNGEFNNNEDLPYLEAKVLRGKKNAISAKKGVKVYKGDYVILVDGENSGEVMKVPYSGYMGSTFKILLVYYNKIADYIKYNIDLERKDLKENKTGSAVPHLNKKIFKRKIIPLPPLAEQERIVKVIESTLKVIN